MTDNTLIAPTTSEEEERFGLSMHQVVTLSAGALTGAEVVDIYIGQGNPLQYRPTGNQLTATETARLLEGPGQYEIRKGATASPVGVYVDGISWSGGSPE